MGQNQTFSIRHHTFGLFIIQKAYQVKKFILKMHNWFLAFKENMKFIMQDADVKVIILKYGRVSLYRAQDRHTIFFSIELSSFPNIIYQIIYHFLLVLRYQAYYISGSPGPSSGLHYTSLFFYFLFSYYCGRSTQTPKCYGSDTHQ